jgi:hypothetical protein
MSAEDSSASNLYFFPKLWEQYSSIAEMENDRKNGIITPDSLRKEGVYYFQTGINAPKSDRGRVEMLRKSVAVLEGLWKRNKSDNRVVLLLGYSYTGVASVESDIELILKYVFRARNMFSIVIDRLPENIDARMGRAHININLTPQTGRPDQLLHDDAVAFLAGYEKLDPSLRDDPYYRMGRSVMKLALGVLAADAGDSAKAKRFLSEVERKDFPENDRTVIDMYTTYTARFK